MELLAHVPFLSLLRLEPLLNKLEPLTMTRLYGSWLLICNKIRFPFGKSSSNPGCDGRRAPVMCIILRETRFYSFPSIRLIG